MRLPTLLQSPTLMSRVSYFTLKIWNWNLNWKCFDLLLKFGLEIWSSNSTLRFFEFQSQVQLQTLLQVCGAPNLWIFMTEVKLKVQHRWMLWNFYLQKLWNSNFSFNLTFSVTSSCLLWPHTWFPRAYQTLTICSMSWWGSICQLHPQKRSRDVSLLPKIRRRVQCRPYKRWQKINRAARKRKRTKGKLMKKQNPDVSWKKRTESAQQILLLLISQTIEEPNTEELTEQEIAGTIAGQCHLFFRIIRHSWRAWEFCSLLSQVFVVEWIVTGGICMHW